MRTEACKTDHTFPEVKKGDRAPVVYVNQSTPVYQGYGDHLMSDKSDDSNDILNQCNHSHAPSI